mmetsp:Transcript_81105/g.262728  ORF Transcript_81105/g.262728 Transcript_81105/m.262728 type:complete len:242 (-) Transcript_81105:84-809(-)
MAAAMASPKRRTSTIVDVTSALAFLRAMVPTAVPFVKAKALLITTAAELSNDVPTAGGLMPSLPPKVPCNCSFLDKKARSVPSSCQSSVSWSSGPSARAAEYRALPIMTNKVSSSDDDGARRRTMPNSVTGRRCTNSTMESHVSLNNMRSGSSTPKPSTELANGKVSEIVRRDLTTVSTSFADLSDSKVCEVSAAQSVTISVATAGSIVAWRSMALAFSAASLRHARAMLPSAMRARTSIV